MQLISKGRYYVIAYEESEGAKGFYFYGDAKSGSIYGAMQLVLAQGIDVTGDEPLDEEIPEDVQRAALKVLDRYRTVGFFR